MTVHQGLMIDSSILLVSPLVTVVQFAFLIVSAIVITILYKGCSQHFYC